MITMRVAAIIAALASATASFATTPDDEAAIRTLEDRFAAALNSGNVDAMMKIHLPDTSLVAFDVVKPGQHLGAEGNLGAKP